VLDDSLPVGRQPPVALYRLAHQCWRDALARNGPRAELAPDHFPLPTPRSGPFFCFERPGRTDLILDGKKLLGSAQRRIPGRVLQHGSLLLGRRFPSHPGADLGGPAPAVVAGWIDGFVQRLAAALGLECRQASWSVEQLEDIERRRRRYADPAWTRRR
jgi:lipoate-protein ligase A